MKTEKVLIVGGVAGGASAAARLRRLDEHVKIIMFEKGEHISFANCGLPYYIGGEITKKSHLTLQTPESFESKFNIDVRVYSEVISINKEEKKVAVKNHLTGEVYDETYDKLVLAPGAEPVKPPVEGIESEKVFTLRNIPDTYKIKDYILCNNPKRAVIVGGGYIGIEMAENLKNAGLDVTVVQRPNQVISPIDYDMACDVHSHIRSKGVKLLLGRVLKSIKEDEKGLLVTLDEGQVETDIIILSIGVKPESDIAKEAGIKLNEKGAIVVDETMLTSDPDIYAAGDAVEVIDFITKEKAVVPLAGPANKQGRIVADNICGIKSKYFGTQRSSILKVFDMTVAATGINEKMAQKLGIEYEKSFTYSADHATYYPGAEFMSIKTLFEKKTGKILGAQVVGFAGSDKRCDVFATAIRFGATAHDLTQLELCYAPPYSSAKDPVNMAGYVIENIISEKVKLFHWHDIENLKKDDSVQLIDARTPFEYREGHIEGFKNIPVEDMRENLKDLDKNKPIYIYCHSGLRSYLTCRILSQNGFDCYNLSGGYRLYDSIFN